MNIILQLFDENFVKDFFRKEILPHYPDFTDIKKIKIQAHKKHIWEKTYHVVIEFTTTFSTKDKKTKKLAIFCSAHSSEPRKNFYDALRFLWDHDFKNGNLTIPHPLFYSEKFNAAFYRGIQGHHLHHFIRQHDFEESGKIIIKAAKWLHKLHKIPTKNAKNFNPDNSHIETVVPGINFILEKIKTRHPEFLGICEKIYAVLTEREKRFFNSTEQRWLIHGDAHPENVIKISKNKLGFIDFTDLCLADFARDLGTFLQQLDYMCSKQTEDTALIEKAKDLFLTTYLSSSKIKLDDSLKERIETYYNFTAIRTATFLLTKEESQPDRAQKLLEKIKYNLKIQ